MKALTLGVAAAALLAMGAGAQAQGKKYTFALVPKNMNNPFFDQARDGCKKAEKESNGAIECIYIGPGEHGGGDEQVQVVNDLITKKVDGIAVSPSNAAAMGRALEAAKKANIPVLTWDSDLLEKDKGLRVAYVGTYNYDIGVEPREARPADEAAGRHDLHPVRRRRGGEPQRAHAGHSRHARGREVRRLLRATKLTGQNGWTEIDGCPLYTDDDFPRAVQQMEDILGKNPQLDAFIPTGGFPQFIPQAYRRVAEKYKARIDNGSLALIVADTLPVQMDLMKAGLSHGQVGQRPFEMGYKTMLFLKDIKDGKAPPKDPTYTGLDVCTPQNAATCIGAGT